MYERKKKKEVQLYSKKSWQITLILCIFASGFYRLYAGKKLWTVILFMFTLGGCWVWWIIDLKKICSGEFTDKDGLPIIPKSWQA